MLFAAPDGDSLDVTSAAWLDLTGRCTMSNRQGSVRCLSRNNLELVIDRQRFSPGACDQ